MSMAGGQRTRRGAQAHVSVTPAAATSPILVFKPSVATERQNGWANNNELPQRTPAFLILVLTESDAVERDSSKTTATSPQRTACASAGKRQNPSR